MIERRSLLKLAAGTAAGGVAIGQRYTDFSLTNGGDSSSGLDQYDLSNKKLMRISKEENRLSSGTGEGVTDYCGSMDECEVVETSNNVNILVEDETVDASRRSLERYPLSEKRDVVRSAIDTQFNKHISDIKENGFSENSPVVVSTDARSESIDSLTIGESGGDHWGFVPGGHNSGSGAFPSIGVASATAVAEVTGGGEITRWASIGAPFVVEGEELARANVSVNGDIRGEVWGISGSTATVEVTLIVENLDRDQRREQQIAFEESTVFSLNFFDYDVSSDLLVHLYPGDRYVAEVRLETTGFVVALGLASADVGPYDGDLGEQDPGGDPSNVSDGPTDQNLTISSIDFDLEPVTSGGGSATETESGSGTETDTPSDTETTEPNEPPTASITLSPLSPVAGETIHFDGSGSSDPDGDSLSYDWTLDGPSGLITMETGRGFSRALSAGEHTVHLEVRDGNGGYDSQTTSFTVAPQPNEPPTASLSLSPSDPVDGETVSFDGSSSSDPDGDSLEYEWALEGSGGLITTASGSTFSEPLAAGEYTVTLEVRDGAGGLDSATKTFTVAPPANDPPTASISMSPASPVAGETINFDGSDSSDPDGDFLEYEWTLEGPDGLITIESGRGFSDRLSQGEYTVNLGVRDSNGGYDSETTTFSVAAFSVDVDKSNPSGYTYEFTARPNKDGVVSYNWTFTDTRDGRVLARKSGKQVEWSAPGTGQYRVDLVATDADGREATATDSVYII